MMRPLYPPLQLVEDELFGQPQDDAMAPTASLTEPDAHCIAPVMPDFLQDLVERRVAGRQALSSVPLATGQIRRLDHVPAAHGPARDLGRACAILLGASLGADRWAGWLVTQESDYASDRDLVLQEHDGPLAPEAAMVQAWNPVECIVDSDAALLGKLAPERLAAVKMLSGLGSATNDFVAPRPGRVGAWDIDSNTTVVTGTPLGDRDDPRHAYQRLYQRLAEEINLASRRMPEQAGASWWAGALDWMRHALVQPALTLAAISVAILQGIWIMAPHDALAPGATSYRSVAAGAGADCAPLVRITFNPDAAHADVLAVMREAGAIFAEGPTDTGDLLVRPASGQDAAVLASTLRQSALVEQADALGADVQGCKSR